MREWREHRQLTLDQVVSRLEVLAENLQITKASLSRIERGLQAYRQPLLEALAEIYQCEPADMLMRDPSQDQMIWSLWERLGESEKRQTLRFIQAIQSDKAA